MKKLLILCNEDCTEVVEWHQVEHFGARASGTPRIYGDGHIEVDEFEHVKVVNLTDEVQVVLSQRVPRPLTEPEQLTLDDVTKVTDSGSDSVTPTE